MATTKKATAKASGKKEAGFVPAPDPEKSAAVAALAMRPTVNAAAVMSVYSKAFDVTDGDIGALVNKLSDDVKDLWAGDMRRAEAMLFGQAHALQAIFMSLSRRADQVDMMAHWEAFMKMAMKAQNQCRMTLETLATIKNPPVVFARQANINNGGQQQVNNGGPAASAPVRAEARAHAANVSPAPTELLEQQHGEWLDNGAASTAGGADPRLEAVAAVNRPAHR